MEPSTSGEIGATVPKSLWHCHKDVLRRLYIVENKTLIQVKEAMENEQGFPTLRLHDYEFALRELLKFRKNLKKEEWYAIGAQLAYRKKHKKESEVLWNNSPVAAKKVRKEVLRNRKLSYSCPRITRTPELPTGVIIRTPPPSPSGDMALLSPPAGFCSELAPSISRFSCDSEDICAADSIISDGRVALHEPAQVVHSRFRALRENLPFNRLISELLQYSKARTILTPITTEFTLIPGPRLFGRNPSLDILVHVSFLMSNGLMINWMNDDHKWFLNWLDSAADIAMLKMFFSAKTPTVRAAYEGLCEEISRLRRSVTTRVLFEIQDIVSNNNPMAADGIIFVDTAVKIGSRADGMLEVAKRAIESCAPLLEGQTFTEQAHFKALFYSAAARRDIAMMRLLVDVVTRCVDETDIENDTLLRMVAGVMHQLYVWESEEEGTIADYIGLLIQGRILSVSLSARCCDDDRPTVAVGHAQTLSVDELVMICPPKRRRSLYDTVIRFSREHRSLVTKAGIFTAALEGVIHLRAYMQSCEQNDGLGIRTTMEESLLFAASLNDVETASALLQVGVDPDVGLLSHNQEHYHKGDSSWNPMVVAAAAGHLETLGKLIEKASSSAISVFLKSAPFFEIVRLKNTLKRYYLVTTGNELLRLENLHRHYLYNEIYNPDLANVVVRKSSFGQRWIYIPRPAEIRTTSFYFVPQIRRIETLSWIRSVAACSGIRESVDEEIIKSALFNDQELHDNLVDSENADVGYHPCDVLLMEGLVDATLGYHEDDMDLFQLSIRNGCSLKVVAFLLGKGFNVHSRPAAQSGNTMLHDALLSDSRDRSKTVELLLQEGADYKYCGDGLTVLEASLHKKTVDIYQDTSLSRQAEYVDLFHCLFKAGAPVQQPPRPQLKERPYPLISLLLDIHAEDNLILQVADAGAELNQRGAMYTPIQLTLLKRLGREILAQELIQRGADVHAFADDFCGLTALQSACMVGSPLQFIKYLVVVQGANVNEAPARYGGRTALQQAASSGFLSIAEFLLEHGANINALSGLHGFRSQPIATQGRALDFAAKNGRLDMVEFLLKAGGRSSTAGLGGAIDRAKSCHHFAVLTVLLGWEKEHGIKILKDEAEWQRRNPDAARLFSEACRDNPFFGHYDSDDFA